MDYADINEKLFDMFPPVPTEEWEAVIRSDLNGADYRELLKWDTGEGIEILPFYRRDDLKEISFPEPGPAGWGICHQVYAAGAPKANESALSAIDRGADALLFRMSIHKGDLEGTAFQNQQHFEAVFKNIPLDETGLYFDAGSAAPLLLAMLENEVVRQGIKPQNITGSLFYDPYALLAVTGRLSSDESFLQVQTAELTRFCRDRFTGIRCLGVDARCYHEAGATLVQELALALATASEHFAMLTEQGFPARDIAKRIIFSFSFGSTLFPEIARFRATRLLWDRLMEAYGIEVEHRVPAYIHGETSRWNKTVYDPYTNLIRTTAEGVAAATGNCDLITVHPFDLALGEPSEASIRLARNTQLIFKEEAFLDKVSDPGRGSYYIEALTDTIAEQSWELFQEIEQQGGMLKALKAGTIAEMVGRSAESRSHSVATGADVLVGTNRYPDPEERVGGMSSPGYDVVSMLESDTDFSMDRTRMIESLAVALSNGACLGDIVPVLPDQGKQLFQTLRPWRAGEAIEKIRIATEKHPDTPVVLLLPMGEPKARRSRSSFAGQFFGCGGYTVKGHTGLDDISDAVQEVRDHLPDLVVICSSDREYPELVPPLCEELQTLEKRPLIALAGSSSGLKEVERFKEAGIDLVIHPDSNLHETLIWVNQKLGIEDYEA